MESGNRNNSVFSIKFVLEFLGVYQSKLLTIKQVVTLISFVYLTVNCILSGKNNWENINHRFTAIRNLNVLLTLFIIYMDYTTRNADIQKLRGLVEKGLFNYVEWMVTDRAKNIINKYNKEIVYFNKIIFYFSLSVALSMVLVPLSLTIFIVFFNNDNIDSERIDISFEDLPIPFKTMYLPAGYSVVTVYAINYVFQFITTMTVLLNVGYCAFIIAYDATNMVANEIELLCECLDEIDCVTRSSENHTSQVDDGGSVFNFHKFDRDKIKIFMKIIVDHHSVIMRKIRIIENGLKVNTSAFSHALVVQLCMSIYIIVQVDSFPLKLENFVSSISVLLNMYMSYNQAQKIFDKSEELRHKIFQCDWIDKPLWFKKCILIMVTSSKRELKISPFGVYIMNRHTFLKIINMSYSYFNVINSVKNSS